jgi:hypothetical protein
MLDGCGTAVHARYPPYEIAAPQRAVIATQP